MARYFFLLVVVTAIVFTSTTCHKPTGPGDDSGISRRDYTWTVDTLVYPDSPMTELVSLWGNSPKNVWAVGHDWNWDANIFHYDGQKWTPITGAVTAQPYAVFYQDIIGFGENELFLVGSKVTFSPIYHESNLIVHYDGTHFQVMDTPVGDNGLLKIWGSDRTNIWACGWDGILFHFDGSVWTRVPFDTTQVILSIFGFGRDYLYSTSAYEVTPDGKYADTTTCFFSSYQNGTWIKEDSLIGGGDRVYWYGFGFNDLWGTSPDNLYSISSWVWHRESGQWKMMLGDYWMLNRIRGSASNNIFALGDNGIVFHFNGENWGRILTNYYNTNARFFAAMPFDKEVFILGFWNNKSWVLHGTLK